LLAPILPPDAALHTVNISPEEYCHAIIHTPVDAADYASFDIFCPLPLRVADDYAGAAGYIRRGAPHDMPRYALFSLFSPMPPCRHAMLPRWRERARRARYDMMRDEDYER